MARRYGWPPRSFRKGARIRYILENTTFYGQEGEILSDSGVIDGTPDSAGQPSWEIKFDSGLTFRLYEWAMEIVT